MQNGTDANAMSPVLPRKRQCRAREVLDLFIDNANTAARVHDTQGAFVLGDLALALIDLSLHPRARATARSYDQPWEMCIERFGSTAFMTVYRAGADPLVAVHDREVSFADVVAATLDRIDELLAAGEPRAGMRAELESAMERLRATARAYENDGAQVPEPSLVVIETDPDAPLSFGSEFTVRDSAPAASVFGGALERGDERTTHDDVERADLHALLFRGRVRAEVGGRSIDLGECYPMLVAERLIELARRAFDAWERGLALHARGEVAGILVGVRVSPEGELALTLGPARNVAFCRPERRAIHTFPALGVTDVLEASLAFGRSLVRAVLRRDREQASNLRLSAMRRMLRDSAEALREACQTDSKVNPSPEPYRAFVAAHDGSPMERTPSLSLARLRYASRWRAVVPGIDLRATYLCGDRLIVGAAAEMWALDRATGRVLWRADVARGTSVVTPGGIARLATDGTLCVYDFGTGEPTLRARIAPRVGGSVSGAVVHLPGLPKLVIVTEGAHHLVAIDLTSGEARWRWSWGAARHSARATPRIKRAGRLVYFTCGDGALTALDVTTGAVVWRVRDRLRFRTPPTVVHDALFVVSGGAHGVARLYCIDPYSGNVRWSTGVTDANVPCTVEGAPLVAEGAVAVAVRQKSGLALAAFRRNDGAPVTRRVRVVAPSGAAWLAVDDVFIGNAPNGELVAIDGPTGELRWRHVSGPRPLEADVPRRLEPVLRCGALFVPCSLMTMPSRSRHGDDHPSGRMSNRIAERFEEAVAGVSVLRPSDGALIGAIAPTDAIPDLLRVDERCDVYVAEESGHVVSFGALPRLSVVGK